MNNLIKSINKTDIKLFYIFNKSIKCSFFDRTFPYITELGGPCFTMIFPVILLLFGRDNNNIKAAGYKCMISLASSHIFIRIMKKIFGRERPFLKLSNVNALKLNLKDHSFPSGHTTATFSLNVTMALVFPQLALFFIAIAILVGISRIYIGVHYPTDVIGGIIVGTTFALLCSSILNDWIIAVLA